MLGRRAPEDASSMLKSRSCENHETIRVCESDDFRIGSIRRPQYGTVDRFYAMVRKENNP